MHLRLFVLSASLHNLEVHSLALFNVSLSVSHWNMYGSDTQLWVSRSLLRDTDSALFAFDDGSEIKSPIKATGRQSAQ